MGSGDPACHPMHQFAVEIRAVGSAKATPVIALRKRYSQRSVSLNVSIDGFS